MKIDCPASICVHRRMPKEAFYKHMTLTSGQKNRFVSDIEKIYAEYSFTADNLRLQKAGSIQEILLLSVELKTDKYDQKIIEAIARQNPHKLVFLLRMEGKEQLAIYHAKLYRTEWLDEDQANLEIKGFSLEEVWNHLVEQIAFCDETDEPDVLSLDERLNRKDEITKLEKEIEKLEAAAWKEPQPKKKYEIYGHLQKYKEELEALKNG